MTEEEKAARIEELGGELQELVRNSLSLQAVGGAHIANELNTIVKLGGELVDEIAALRAQIT